MLPAGEEAEYSAPARCFGTGFVLVSDVSAEKKTAAARKEESKKKVTQLTQFRSRRSVSQRECLSRQGRDFRRTKIDIFFGFRVRRPE